MGAHSATPRAVCYACRVRRSTVRGQGGSSILEVLAVTLIVGLAVIGVALMFGRGSAWVAASGADRVAAGLAQQRIEQIRAGGWGPAIAPDTLGIPLTENIALGDGRTFIRQSCVQYVDDSTAPGATAAGLTQPAYVPDTCVAGTQSSTVRITVIVSTRQVETTGVTLQAWMTEAGP